MQIDGQYPLQVTMVTIQAQTWLPSTAVLSCPNTFGGSSGAPLYTKHGKLHGLHYAGNEEYHTGVHLAHQTVRQYLEEARHLQIAVDVVQRAHEAQASPPSSDPALLVELSTRLKSAAYSLVALANNGGWTVVVKPQ